MPFKQFYVHSILRGFKYSLCMLTNKYLENLKKKYYYTPITKMFKDEKFQILFAH